MEKKTVGLLGALAGLAAMGSAQAAISPAPNPSEAMRASSYAELLAPIPDAVALLKADDNFRRQKPVAETLNGVQLAQDQEHHQQYQQQLQHHHHHQQYRQQLQNHHHHQQYRQQPQHHHHHQQYQ